MKNKQCSNFIFICPNSKFLSLFSLTVGCLLHLYGYERPAFSSWASPLWYSANILKEWLLSQPRRSEELQVSYTPRSPSSSPPTRDHSASSTRATESIGIQTPLTSQDTSSQASTSADNFTASSAVAIDTDDTLSVTLSDPIDMDTSEYMRALISTQLLSASNQPRLSKGPPYDENKGRPGSASV